MPREFRITYTDGHTETIEADFHDHDIRMVGAEHAFGTIGADGAAWIEERVVDAGDVVDVAQITPDPQQSSGAAPTQGSARSSPRRRPA